jgi:predicted N-acyltransferase
MLSNVSASQTIEAERKSDAYYLTSKVLSLGSLFTEGDHLFLDAQHPLIKDALSALLQTLENLEQTLKSKMIVLRDFSDDAELHSFFQGQGFVRIKMPDSCDIELSETIDIETFVSQLSSRNRKHLRKEILAIEPLLKIDFLEHCTKDQLKQVEELYSNVHQNNLGLNTFSFPAKLFEKMSIHPSWEFISISPLTEPDKMIGVMMCYKNSHKTYVPAFVGMNYHYLHEFHIYRQLLYQTIKRAIELDFRHIALGLTASFEKRKLGASVHDKYAYIQTSDNYTLELMGILESS